MAFTYAWTAIPDTDTDPDSPVTTGLMTGINHDLIHLREWLGASFVAGAVPDHNHDGVNSKVIAIANVQSESIRADFAQTVLDSDDWSTNLSASSTATMKVGTATGHVVRLTEANVTGGVAAIYGATKRISVELNKDEEVTFECRVKEDTGVVPTSVFYGFTVTGGTVTSPIANCIGFVKGTNVSTYRLRVSKAGTATLSTDNLGNRTAYQVLTIIAKKAGATLQVNAYIDGTEIGGSPITTNIPDTSILVPTLGLESTTTNGAFVDVDRADCYFNARPVAP